MNRVLRLAEIAGDTEAVDMPAGAPPQINPEHLRMVEALLFAASEPLSAESLSGSLPEGADIAALLLTGDLTDAGDPASYARLRRLLEPVAVPVLCAAGNNDDRAALREHLLGVAPRTRHLTT